MTILILTNYTSMHPAHYEWENWIWINNEYECWRLEFEKMIMNYNMQMRFLWIPYETLASPRWDSRESQGPWWSGQYLTVTCVLDVALLVRSQHWARMSPHPKHVSFASQPNRLWSPVLRSSLATDLATWVKAGIPGLSSPTPTSSRCLWTSLGRSFIA